MRNMRILIMLLIATIVVLPVGDALCLPVTEGFDPFDKDMISDNSGLQDAETLAYNDTYTTGSSSANGQENADPAWLYWLKVATKTLVALIGVYQVCVEVGPCDDTPPDNEPTESPEGTITISW